MPAAREPVPAGSGAGGGGAAAGAARRLLRLHRPATADDRPFLTRGGAHLHPGDRLALSGEERYTPGALSVVKLLSYNVLEGALPDRLEAVLEVIESAEADVIAVQEARYWRRNRREVFRRVGRRLGMPGLLAHANSGFDLAVFTRLRTSGYTNYGLDSMLLHTAASVEIEAPSGRRFALFAAHLRPDLPGRAQEASLLRAWMAPHREQECVLCGDLNSLTPGDPVARRLLRPGSELGRSPDGVIAGIRRDGWRDCLRVRSPRTGSYTLGAGRRVARVDYIFASRSLAERLVGCRVHQHPRALTASDHSPVWAKFDI